MTIWAVYDIENTLSLWDTEAKAQAEVARITASECRIYVAYEAFELNEEADVH